MRNTFTAVAATALLVASCGQAQEQENPREIAYAETICTFVDICAESPDDVARLGKIARTICSAINRETPGSFDEAQDAIAAGYGVNEMDPIWVSAAVDIYCPQHEGLLDL